MRTVVISQPMFFPWVGMFEQLRLADVYLHYDDVQYSKGSFTNRVQVKTAQGSRWLTVPLRQLKLGQPIMEVRIDDATDWRAQHLALLEKAYAAAPRFADMMSLAREVYEERHETISDLSIASMNAVLRYFSFDHPKEIHWSSRTPLPSSSSERVLAYVLHFRGDRYITGHGARNYLDHELFERQGVQVEYMNYLKRPYPQLHGEFTPFVSVLDLIAHCGKSGVSMFSSGTIPWRQMLSSHESH
ncbi:MAG: WbqC family protein [Verrucomicrobia bacterium]|nr:WbqC family protein [Verrucomicrobiota bacterium]